MRPVHSTPCEYGPIGSAADGAVKGRMVCELIKEQEMVKRGMLAMSTTIVISEARRFMAELSLD